ncbi:MAG: class I SAM-dependent methyltransferase [bacterium]
MFSTIWKFWAPRYERLYAQYFALGPTRKLVIDHLHSIGASPLHILDLGCGIGQLASELADLYPNAEITAIDPTSAMIKRAMADYTRTNITYHTGVLNDIPTDKRFDLIVSTHSFPYISDKLSALQQIRAMLNSGGRVIIIQGNTQNLYDKLFFLGVKLTVSKAEYLSTQKISQLMKSANLNVTAITPLPRKWFIPSVYLVEGTRE